MKHAERSNYFLSRLLLVTGSLRAPVSVLPSWPKNSDFTRTKSSSVPPEKIRSWVTSHRSSRWSRTTRHHCSCQSLRLLEERVQESLGESRYDLFYHSKPLERWRDFSCQTCLDQSCLTVQQKSVSIFRVENICFTEEQTSLYLGYKMLFFSLRTSLSCPSIATRNP